MSHLESMYYPIWDRLKREKQISITANRLLHSRIVKAVTKRKWLDVGFKLEIEPSIAILSHARKHSVLTFFLEIRKSNLDMRARKGPITEKDF